MRTLNLSSALLAASLLFAACLSPRPTVLVRWFDATPVVVGDGARPAVARCTAAAQLGQSMLWRTGMHEYAFDEQHRWLVTPAEMVAAAVGQPAPIGDVGVALHVLAFGGDLTGSPIATLTVQATHEGRERAFVANAPLADATAAALAAGMAQALAQLRDELAGWVASGQ